MTIEQIKTEVKTLMDKVMELETKKEGITFTKDELYELIKVVIEDTTTDIREGFKGGLNFIEDDFVDISLEGRELYVEVNTRDLEFQLVEMIDENGLYKVTDENQLKGYVDGLVKKVNL